MRGRFATSLFRNIGECRRLGFLIKLMLATKFKIMFTSKKEKGVQLQRREWIKSSLDIACAY